jgi:hypothetical protein
MLKEDESMENKKGLFISDRGGFSITFDNQHTVSVQFGRVNYCANRDYTPYSLNNPHPKECINAEVATWDESGNWTTREVFKNLYGETLYDDVKGHVSPEKIAHILYYVSKLEE